MHAKACRYMEMPSTVCFMYICTINGAGCMYVWTSTQLVIFRVFGRCLRPMEVLGTCLGSLILLINHRRHKGIPTECNTCNMQFGIPRKAHLKRMGLMENRKSMRAMRCTDIVNYALCQPLENDKECGTVLSAKNSSESSKK